MDSVQDGLGEKGNQDTLSRQVEGEMRMVARGEGLTNDPGVTLLS